MSIKYANTNSLQAFWNKCKDSFSLPSDGTSGQILTKTDTGASWSDAPSGGSSESEVPVYSARIYNSSLTNYFVNQVSVARQSSGHYKLTVTAQVPGVYVIYLRPGTYNGTQVSDYAVFRTRLYTGDTSEFLMNAVMNNVGTGTNTNLAIYEAITPLYSFVTSANQTIFECFTNAQSFSGAYTFDCFVAISKISDDVDSFKSCAAMTFPLSIKGVLYDKPKILFSKEIASGNLNGTYGSVRITSSSSENKFYRITFISKLPEGSQDVAFSFNGSINDNPTIYVSANENVTTPILYSKSSQSANTIISVGTYHSGSNSSPGNFTLLIEEM